MCRILMARSESPFLIPELLVSFAQLAKNSREYQGHGWGCSWLTENTDTSGRKQWQHYHNIMPVWEDDITQFESTKLLMVHARSAFRDEGIAVENNMPFTDGESVFIFNGELRGVKIKSEGRIGAEKIYNYIRRMNSGLDQSNILLALEKGVGIINRRTTYVRAMNIILSDGDDTVVSSTYGEDPDYFQMHQTTRDGLTLVCSEPFAGQTDWTPMGNHFTSRV